MCRLLDLLMNRSPLIRQARPKAAVAALIMAGLFLAYLGCIQVHLLSEPHFFHASQVSIDHHGHSHNHPVEHSHEHNSQDSDHHDNALDHDLKLSKPKESLHLFYLVGRGNISLVPVLHPLEISVLFSDTQTVHCTGPPSPEHPRGPPSLPVLL
jgi:hypothetical protein